MEHVGTASACPCVRTGDGVGDGGPAGVARHSAPTCTDTAAGLWTTAQRSRCHRAERLDVHRPCDLYPRWVPRAGASSAEWLTVPACPDRLPTPPRTPSRPASRRCPGAGRPCPARRRAGVPLAGAEGNVVEVRRSARRRRTVTAYREQGRTVVLIPAAFSPAEERRWVAQMVAKLQTREERRRRSLGGDEELMARARALSAAHLDGLAEPASVRWVDNQQRRWGSCTPADRSIRLSSRLRSMPEYVVDYVLVHELVHLLEPGHDERFWAWSPATRGPSGPAASSRASSWPATRRRAGPADLRRLSPSSALAARPALVRPRARSGVVGVRVVGGQRGELVVETLAGDEVHRLVEVVRRRQQVRVRPEPVAVGAAVAAGPSQPTPWRRRAAGAAAAPGPTSVANVCSAGPPEARRRRIVSASAECPGSRSFAASATTVSTQPSTSASSVSRRRSAICCSGVSSGSSTPLPSSCWMLSGSLGSMPPSMPGHRLGDARARWPRGRS